MNAYEAALAIDAELNNRAAAIDQGYHNSVNTDKQAVPDTSWYSQNIDEFTEFETWPRDREDPYRMGYTPYADSFGREFDNQTKDRVGRSHIGDFHDPYEDRQLKYADKGPLNLGLLQYARFSDLWNRPGYQISKEDRKAKKASIDSEISSLMNLARAAEKASSLEDREMYAYALEKGLRRAGYLRGKDEEGTIFGRTEMFGPEAGSKRLGVTASDRKRLRNIQRHMNATLHRFQAEDGDQMAFFLRNNAARAEEAGDLEGASHYRQRAQGLLEARQKSEMTFTRDEIQRISNAGMHDDPGTMYSEVRAVLDDASQRRSNENAEAMALMLEENQMNEGTGSFVSFVNNETGEAMNPGEIMETFQTRDNLAQYMNAQREMQRSDIEMAYVGTQSGVNPDAPFFHAVNAALWAAGGAGLAPKLVQGARWGAGALKAARASKAVKGAKAAKGARGPGGQVATATDDIHTGPYWRVEKEPWKGYEYFVPRTKPQGALPPGRPPSGSPPPGLPGGGPPALPPGGSPPMLPPAPPRPMLPPGGSSTALVPSPPGPLVPTSGGPLMVPPPGGPLATLGGGFTPSMPNVGVQAGNALMRGGGLSTGGGLGSATGGGLGSAAGGGLGGAATGGAGSASGGIAGLLSPGASQAVAQGSNLGARTVDWLAPRAGAIIGGIAGWHFSKWRGDEKLAWEQRQIEKERTPFWTTYGPVYDQQSLYSEYHQPAR